MNLAVVGTGYVGLVSGVCLASKGHSVTCVDIDANKVEKINDKIPPIHEEGLPELLARVVDSGVFRATTNLTEALDVADAVILAVGTPSTNGKIDLKFLKLVSSQVGAYLRTADKFLSVIVKSTVLPSTTDTVVRKELESASGKHLGEGFGLGMNPEFLREGKAIFDFMYPDRIVFGHEDTVTLSVLEEIYQPWPVDKLRVNTRTAEMIKYSNNCLLALQISAANELANLAARVGGIDYMQVVEGVTLDKRWNPIKDQGGRVNPEILTYLTPGPGFGGSCFPKDVQALRSQGEELGMPMGILNAVLDVNEAQPKEAVSILKQSEGNLKGKNVLVLGLAFKPDTDDVRESASIVIVDELLEAEANVQLHDPVATENFVQQPEFKDRNLNTLDSWDQEVARADIIIVATKWLEYRRLAKFDLSDKVVFDSRRLFQPGELAQAKYLSIGLRT
ncbi:MAG TPA: UDP-glucose/GDP-mannose dehydrogenase family protein [Fimbriimonadaceae bacterium]|jgi:UDPglucose 6-dehydrogenase/GDP-mannose 6-dehydrogenase